MDSQWLEALSRDYLKCVFREFKRKTVWIRYKASKKSLRKKHHFVMIKVLQFVSLLYLSDFSVAPVYLVAVFPNTGSLPMLGVAMALYWPRTLSLDNTPRVAIIKHHHSHHHICIIGCINHIHITQATNYWICYNFVFFRNIYIFLILITMNQQFQVK